METLVSILIITYNSSKYILDALESAKCQDYKNIELVISDDCSSDNTVIICREWLQKNHHYFKRCIIDQGSINKGVPANCNKGIRRCKGEWIKIIAGDDILKPNCIESLVKLITDQKDIIVGRMQEFYFSCGEKLMGQIFPLDDRMLFFKKNSNRQHKILLLNSFNFSPAAIIRKSLFNKVGYYDEKYTLIEDLPFWIKVTGLGIRIYSCDDIVVEYRINQQSLSNSGRYLFNKKFVKCVNKFHREVVYKQISKWNIVYYQNELHKRVIYYIVCHLCNNKNTRFTRLLSSLVMRLTLRQIFRLPKH